MPVFALSPEYRLVSLIDLLERVALRFEREEPPPQKLRKLEGFVVQYGLPLAEAVPLFAALLSLPLTGRLCAADLAPEQQKQQTMQTLLTIVLRIAAQQPGAPGHGRPALGRSTTLEFLSLLVDQGPTARILALFTFRPDFQPTLDGALTPHPGDPAALAAAPGRGDDRRVAHGKTLPPEVVEQVVARTDGVPLFVEELTKMVLESGLLQEREEPLCTTGPLPAGDSRHAARLADGPAGSPGRP